MAVAEITFADFNINGGYRTHGGSWRERLPLVVETMLAAKASVYLLQEAHEEWDEHRQVLVELRRQSGKDSWSLIRGDGGNHFIVDSLKHVPVHKPYVYRLPHRRDYVELNLWHKLTGVRYWTWNTHLIAADSKRGRTPAIAAAMRVDQAEFIADRLKRLHRCVGGGDFNDPDDASTDPSSPLAHFQGVGHQDVRASAPVVSNGEFDSHDGYRNNRMRGKWIDQLTHGSLVEVLSAGLIDSGNASDHNLVHSTVRITGPVTNLAGN